MKREDHRPSSHAPRPGFAYNTVTYAHSFRGRQHEVRFVSYKFQVHLRGIIELLSKHLYSGPQVYLRELLQNGVDAIRARTAIEPNP